MINKIREHMGRMGVLAMAALVVASLAAVGPAAALDGDGTLGYTITDNAADGNAEYTVTVDATSIEGADSVDVTITDNYDSTSVYNVQPNATVIEAESFAAGGGAEFAFKFEVLNANGDVIETVNVTDTADGTNVEQQASAATKQDVRITAINGGDGSSISNATVTITNADGQTVEKTTGENAMFSLADGDYTVDVSHPDYGEPITDSSHRLVSDGYSLDFTVDGGIVSKNVYLSPADDTTTETETVNDGTSTDDGSADDGGDTTTTTTTDETNETTDENGTFWGGGDANTGESALLYGLGVFVFIGAVAALASRVD